MARDGGRPCGCDPKINHPCEDHGRHVDETEGVFTGYGDTAVFVSGPDKIGLFTIGVRGRETAISVERFVLEDIIADLERRLKERV